MANYLYNGAELPALPERDEATYPYAYLMHEDGTNLYSLFFSMRQISVNKAGGHLFLTDASSYNYTPKSGGWINVNSGGLGQKVVWSNTDVYYSDSLEEVGGTLYLAASEPVPIVPTPPSAQTAFCIGKAFGRLIRDSISAQST